jgi:hypothetical protein
MIGITLASAKVDSVMDTTHKDPVQESGDLVTFTKAGMP